MKITKDAVVSLEYKLEDDAGKVLDASRETPLYYLHGHHNIVAGLEQALEGKRAGDEVRVTVPPDQGYGVRDESQVFEVDKAQLGDGFRAERGTKLTMTIQGQKRPATVTKVKLRSVVVDANHPLADLTLHFDVRVKDVRKATKEELAHGHAHGPGGHH